MINNGLTLGELISELEKRPKTDTVQFDFGGLKPSGLCSYRGFYEDIAIESVGPHDLIEGDGTVGWFLEILKAAAQGKTFEGWKGGAYTAGQSSAVWVANTRYQDT